MKKFLALVMAGTMLVTTPVMAAGSPNADSVSRKPKRRPPKPPVECSQAVEAPSVSTDVVQAATAEGKTVGEYMNNVLVTIPGLENPVPIGQGGHVIINDAPSNQVFTLYKPTSAVVDSAKIFAAALGGRVLTVAHVKASVSGFRTARVNFYLKGIKAGQNIKAFQIVNGRWLEVDVIEVRDDHVIVEMTSTGTLAFVEMPSK